MKKINHDRKQRKKMRVRDAIVGTPECPRLSVHRSNKYVYVQAIDDTNKVTLASFSSRSLSKKEDAVKMKKGEMARATGKELAKLLLAKKIARGVYDRGMYIYLGRVKQVAEGLREGGIAI